MAWRIIWEGEVYREVDLTFGQTRRIEKMCNSTWLTIAPLRSADHAAAILTVCMADRLGISDAEAEARVNASKIDPFMDCIVNEDLEKQLDLPDVYEDGLPKAEGGSATT